MGTLNAQTLLEFLEGCGVRPRADGDVIRFAGATGIVTPELREIMKPHKAGLLALLRIDPDGDYHAPDGGVWTEIPGGWRLTNPPKPEVRHAPE